MDEALVVWAGGQGIEKVDQSSRLVDGFVVESGSDERFPVARTMLAGDHDDHGGIAVLRGPGELLPEK